MLSLLEAKETFEARKQEHLESHGGENAMLTLTTVPHPVELSNFAKETHSKAWRDEEQLERQQARASLPASATMPRRMARGPSNRPSSAPAIQPNTVKAIQDRSYASQFRGPSPPPAEEAEEEY